MQEVKIQVLFSQDGLSDSLYFTPEEWLRVDDQKIKELKQERVDSWQYAIDHPVSPPEKTDEELLEEYEEVQRQLELLSDRKDELEDILDIK